MSNQKNDPDWLSPSQQDAAAFFRSLGIEPIIIDPNDSKSVDEGIESIDSSIRDAAKGKDGNDERD